MNEKIIKLIMRNPFQFIITGIVLLMIYPLAIWLLNYQRVIALGFIGVVGMGVLFGLFSILLWWLVTYIVTGIVYKKVTENKTEFREYLKTWQTSILFGSAASGFWSGIVLLAAYLFSWRFKTFFIIVLVIPLIRLTLYMTFERWYYKNKNVASLIDD